MKMPKEEIVQLGIDHDVERAVLIGRDFFQSSDILPFFDHIL
jgi:hypothetical protein